MAHNYDKENIPPEIYPEIGIQAGLKPEEFERKVYALQEKIQKTSNGITKSLKIGPDVTVQVFFKDRRIERIICAVEEVIEGSKISFYFLSLDQDWSIEHHLDPRDRFTITIYGLKKGDIKVLASTGVTGPQRSFPVHRKLKRNIGRHDWLPHNDWTEELEDVKVVQEVKEVNESTVVFKCKKPEDASHYIQIIQTTSSQGPKVTCNEYINLTAAAELETCGVELPSREGVDYVMYAVKATGKGYTVEKISPKSHFITHNLKRDVQGLHDQALSFLGISGKMRIVWLYRNKPKDHPTIIEAFETGVMSKYIKDNNGDPASSINHQIKGLFFCATQDPKTHNPHAKSPFGDFRILVRPEILLADLNIYFADFYCLHSGIHYVTLVATTPDSLEDDYCKLRLVKLDAEDNEFLFRTEDGYFTIDHGAVRVEVLYTENLHYQEMLDSGMLTEKHNIKLLGNGQSTIDGIPKTKDCVDCNLSKRPYKYQVFTAVPSFQNYLFPYGNAYMFG